MHRTLATRCAVRGALTPCASRAGARAAILAGFAARASGLPGVMCSRIIGCMSDTRRRPRHRRRGDRLRMGVEAAPLPALGRPRATPAVAASSTWRSSLPRFVRLDAPASIHDSSVSFWVRAGRTRASRPWARERRGRPVPGAVAEGRYRPQARSRHRAQVTSAKHGPASNAVHGRSIIASAPALAAGGWRVPRPRVGQASRRQPPRRIRCLLRPRCAPHGTAPAPSVAQALTFTPCAEDLTCCAAARAAASPSLRAATPVFPSPSLSARWRAAADTLWGVIWVDAEPTGEMLMYVLRSSVIRPHVIGPRRQATQQR